jgi:hypothetical protein
MTNAFRPTAGKAGIAGIRSGSLWGEPIGASTQVEVVRAVQATKEAPLC